MEITLSKVQENEIVDGLIVANLETEMGKVFHWQIYLTTTNDMYIMINMTLPLFKGSSTNGILKMEEKIYGISKSISSKINITNVDGKTVKDFKDVILNNGYNKYKFTDNGEGCRYWVSLVISLFEENRLIALGSRTLLDSEIERIASENPSKVPFPIIKGVFY